MEENLSKIIDMASYAGKILLESGADIVRVEETISHIMRSYGVRDFEVFTVANGIFISSGDCKRGIDAPKRHDYLRIRSIPLISTNLGKLDAVNTLSRDIEQGKYKDVDEAFSRLCEIESMRPLPPAVRMLGSALASSGLCYTFGGTFVDAAIAFVVGFLFFATAIYLDEKKLSRLLTNIICSAALTLIAAIFTTYLAGNMDRVMIGCLMPLVPGVSFTNAIRDIAASNYISGAVRLIDALLVAFGIAIGVGATSLCLTFLNIL